MNISIILVSYNTKDLTRDCINSIYKYTKDVEFEIFADMIEKEFPDVKLIRNPDNKGFGAANNIAIRLSNAKYVFLLNTDTVLINNAIKIMYDFLEKNPDVGACGGNLYDENMQPSTSKMPFPNVLNCTSISWIYKAVKNKLYKLKEIKKVEEVDSIIGADMLLRKSVLDEVGLFDENIFMYGEEVDLCKRIKNNGYKIKAIPEPKIIHFGGKSTSNFFKNIKLRVQNKYYYVRKHNGKLCLYLMKLSYCTLHLICYIFTLNKNHLDLLKLHYSG